MACAPLRCRKSGEMEERELLESSKSLQHPEPSGHSCAPTGLRTLTWKAASRRVTAILRQDLGIQRHRVAAAPPRTTNASEHCCVDHPGKPRFSSMRRSPPGSSRRNRRTPLPIDFLDPHLGREGGTEERRPLAGCWKGG
jgi:hypothetical protein